MWKQFQYFLFHLLLILLNIFTLIVVIFNKKYGFIMYNKTIKIIYHLFFKINIINKEYYLNTFFSPSNIKNKYMNYIYCPNHQSIDIYMQGLNSYNNYNKESISIVKQTSIFFPILGLIWYLLDYIFIDRSKKMNTTDYVSKFLIKNKNYSIGIFPEGTRQYNLKFNKDIIKTGPFVISTNTNIPILPIYHNIGKAINDKNFTIKFGETIHILIGKPLYPNKYNTIDEYKNEYIKQMLELEKEFYDKIN
jgi:1-acyl-sn-glycerol-3-phosphate acyltransferase